jgi:chaperonin GroEL
LQKAFQTEKPLLIIAPDIEGDVLGSLVVSKVKNNLPVVAVKSPWFGDRRKDILDDIALVTGATVVSKALGHNFNKMPLGVLGRAKKVIVNKETTVLVTEQTPELDVKVKALEEMKNAI